MGNQIRCIIFDLDGVLCDCKTMHYESLNKCLEMLNPKYVIGREEHLSKYDGLNTKKKLEMLTAERGLPEVMHEHIYNVKQTFTQELIQEMQTDITMRLMLRKLKEDGYIIAVASNSIRQTLKLMLVKRGLLEYIDFYYSNEDVANPKPATEIYLRCMIKANVSPKETLILEDSIHGRRAAIASGAFLMGVKNTSDVTYNNIKSMIGNIQTHYEVGKEKWQDRNLNILIPLAGLGSRFQKAGYTFPKPLVEVKGKPMVQMVVDNLNIDAHYIFIVQKDHDEQYNLRTLLGLICPGSDVISIDGLTDGAACTTLAAKDFINNNDPLLIANSDQFLVYDSTDFMYSMVGDACDGGIITFTGTHPKWSFAEVNEKGIVTRVAEKDPISSHASTGVYYYAKGSDYVKYVEQMIQKEIMVNGEYYVCPVFNEAIADGKIIKNYHIDEFYGTGTPEDLNYFIQNYKE